MGKEDSHSQKETDWLGREKEVHHDSQGNKIGETRFTSDWLGNTKRDHFDNEGSKTGETRKGSDWLGRDIAFLSNQDFLTLSFGGYYAVFFPVDLRLPMPPGLRRIGKKEIERVGPTLVLRDSCALSIPRQGHISLISNDPPLLISCKHGSYNSDFLNPVMGQITGKFMLVDEGLENSFMTHEGREVFCYSVDAAGTCHLCS